MVVAEFELEHFPKKSPILLKYGLAYQGIKGQEVVVDAIIPIDSTTIMVENERDEMNELALANIIMVLELNHTTIGWMGTT